MSVDGQKITKEVYENPEVVHGYIKEHSLQPKLPRQVLFDFYNSLPGNKILDLGCGPGHDSYTFSELGCDVIGLDYSNQMIQAADNLKKVHNQPYFMVGDMNMLSTNFEPESFDGIWACASLLHIEKTNIESVIHQMHSILNTDGKAFITVKGGDGEQLVTENKYGPIMEREFIFWQLEEFTSLLSETGFVIDKTTSESKLNRQKSTETSWLNFWVSKN